MAAKRVKFSSQVSPDLLAGMRAIAKHEGRHFQSVLEDAMRSYIEAKAQGKVRPEVMAISERVSSATVASVNSSPTREPGFPDTGGDRCHTRCRGP